MVHSFRWRRWWIALLLATLAASARGSLSASPPIDPPLSICEARRQRADLDIVLPGVYQTPVALSAFLGQVVVLNFWATWCLPCRAEVKDLVALQSRFGGSGLQVVGIAVDDTAERIKAFAAEFHVNYPLLQEGEDHVAQRAFSPIWGVPTTILIQRDGTICKRYRGPAQKARLERDVRAIL